MAVGAEVLRARVGSGVGRRRVVPEQEEGLPGCVGSAAVSL